MPNQNTKMDFVVSLVAPCSHCGTTCLGTYRFWYEIAGSSGEVEVDQPTLDELLGGPVGHSDYSLLPELVRAHNEGRAPFDGRCTSVAIPELLRALELLESVVTDPPRSERRHALTNALRELAFRASAAGAPLNVEEM